MIRRENDLELMALRFLTVVAGIVFVGSLAYADLNTGWQAPSGIPTANNTEPPINKGRETQTKVGGLDIRSVMVRQLGFFAQPVGGYNLYGVGVGKALGADMAGGLDIYDSISSGKFCLGQKPETTEGGTTYAAGCISKWSDIPSVSDFNLFGGIVNRLVKWTSESSVANSLIVETNDKISMPLATEISAGQNQDGLSFARLNINSLASIASSSRRVLSVDGSGNVVLIEAECAN